jgi:hypothetical protein
MAVYMLAFCVSDGFTWYLLMCKSLDLIWQLTKLVSTASDIGCLKPTLIYHSSFPRLMLAILNTSFRTSMDIKQKTKNKKQKTKNKGIYVISIYYFQ